VDEEAVVHAEVVATAEETEAAAAETGAETEAVVVEIGEEIEEATEAAVDEAVVDEGAVIAADEEVVIEADEAGMEAEDGEAEDGEEGMEAVTTEDRISFLFLLAILATTASLAIRHLILASALGRERGKERRLMWRRAIDLFSERQIVISQIAASRCGLYKRTERIV